MPWAARRPGRWAAAIAAALLLAGALALTLAERAGWPVLGRVLQGELSRGSGRAVALSDCRARLLTGPWLECGRVTLGPDRWFDGTQVRVDWRWGELWRWYRGDGLRLRNVQARSLQANLQRDAQGRGNWQRAGADPGSAQDEAAQWPAIDRLAIDAGRLRWQDVRERTLVDATITSLDGGGMRADLGGRWRDIDIALQAASSAPLPLLQTLPHSGKQPLQVQGTVGTARVAFAGHAAALLGARELDGALTLGGTSLARIGESLGVTLPQTPPFELRGQITYAGGVWRLDATTARIGRSRLGGDFAYDTQARPPHLTGRLRGERLLLADLGPSIGVTPAPSRSGVLPDRRFDLPSLRAMQADVAVDLDSVDLNSAAVRPLRKLRTRIVLRNGSLHLQDIDAEVAGGRLRGDTRLDSAGAAATTPSAATAAAAAQGAPARQTARWAARLQLQGVDVATWFPAVRKAAPPPRGATAGPAAAVAARPGTAPAYITGTLDAAVDVQGTGASTAQILSTLDGQVDVHVRDGTLSHLLTEAVGLDLAQALGVMVKGDAALPLRCAVVRLRLDDGVAEAGPALLDNRDSSLRIAGRISLADETLALVVRSRPKDISPLSLRAPVTVTGPWSDPVIGIEGRSLAGRVLGAAALGAALGPLAALLPLIDLGDKSADDPCAQPNVPATAAAAAASPRR